MKRLEVFHIILTILQRKREDFLLNIRELLAKDLERVLDEHPKIGPIDEPSYLLQLPS